MNKLFSDMKTDEEKSAFFLSGRGYETGVIAAAIQNDVAMAYHRCAEYKKEVQALREALWLATEHNALHFGESHNTVIQGRAALAAMEKQK